MEGKVVVVLSNSDGCVVARSNEAKALGIKEGTPYFQLAEQFPNQKKAVFSSNYELYGELTSRVVSFLELSCRSCLYIFEISCLSVASFTIIFSHSEGCLFTLLKVFFVVQKLLSLIRSHLFIFAFISNILGGGS